MDVFEKKVSPNHTDLGRSELLIIEDLTKSNINERLARRGTMLFGSMWTFYAFVIYGALGAFFVSQQATLMYWSNWIQLWSMPLLMVGGLVSERASEKRAQATYDVTSAVLHQTDQVQARLDHQDEQITILTNNISLAIKALNDLQKEISSSVRIT